jgi:hypothetical protein
MARFILLNSLTRKEQDHEEQSHPHPKNAAYSDGVSIIYRNTNKYAIERSAFP